MSGIIGKKIGMTSIYDESGKNIPCTIVQAGPCIITQIKTEDKDGYSSFQLGFDEKIKNCTIIDNLPIKISKLVEIINLNFLKKQFQAQSEHKITKYTLDLNSRKISFENKSLNLTEKESDLILFINSHKRADLKKIQKTVWGHSNDLETHTVETHIYRLRKKMIKNFADHNFIKHDQDGYFIN